MIKFYSIRSLAYKLMKGMLTNIRYTNELFCQGFFMICVGNTKGPLLAAKGKCPM